MRRTLLFLLALGLSWQAFGQDTITNRLVSVDNWGVNLSFTENDTSNLFASVPLIGLESGSASSQALFLHPETYQLIMLGDTTSDNADVSRKLYEVNPLSGELNMILDLGDFFATADITPEGRIFAILGNGTSNTRGALYEVDLVTGAIDSIAVTDVPNGEPRAVCYNAATNELWIYSGYEELIYTMEVDNWDQRDTIVAPNGGGEEIHGMHIKDGVLLSSNYSGEIWSVSTEVTNDSLQEATYIVDMPSHVMDLTELKLIASMEDVALCPNATEDLTLSALYTSASYQWHMDGEALENDTLPSLVVQASGEYQLLTEIDSSNMYIMSEVITVFDATVPNVSIDASGTVLCPGESITLTGSTGGKSQWYKDDAVIDGANNNVLVVTEAGSYNMMKTNQSGCSAMANNAVVITAGSDAECNPGVGVNNNITESNIIIYPTVTDGLVWINNNLELNMTVNVYSLTGNQIINRNFEAHQNVSIDLSTYANGLYILHVVAGDIVKTQRVIKE